MMHSHCSGRRSSFELLLGVTILLCGSCAPVGTSRQYVGPKQVPTGLRAYFRQTALDNRRVLDYLVTLQFVKKKFHMD